MGENIYQEKLRVEKMKIRKLGKGTLEKREIAEKNELGKGMVRKKENQAKGKKKNLENEKQIERKIKNMFQENDKFSEGKLIQKVLEGYQN